MIELLSPAGNLEKLSTAVLYGADAVYLGFEDFSLRAHTKGGTGMDPAAVREAAGSVPVYGALNIYFHDEDLSRLQNALDRLEQYRFDAFIVSDIGAARILKNRFPEIPLHLSTQANCINSAAARVYHEMGFTRIVPGRELRLDEIRRIKDAVPELELEIFVHGAMCLAYAGRCFLSRWMSDRSANQGDCAHSCRWDWRLRPSPDDITDALDLQRTSFPENVHKFLLGQGAYSLEERSRPGELYPVMENAEYTTLLSSRDLCMIDHLNELIHAGADALKIEGRMKSAYYVAVVTRAYRKALDSLSGQTTTADAAAFREDLFRISHREFSTGFFFGDGEIHRPTETSYLEEYRFLGIVGDRVGPDGPKPEGFRFIARNQIQPSDDVEFIGPDLPSRIDPDFRLFDPDSGEPVRTARPGYPYLLKSGIPVQSGFIARRKMYPDERIG
jgi:U32 family peptidase